LNKLSVKRVIIFKHGVSYFLLEGKIIGNGVFELEFKIDEMNDILKSLFVLDTSEKGYISSISYDAALDTYQLLKSIMLNIPDTDSFSSLITQIKGAKVNLTIGTSKKISGTVMGIELIEKLNREGKISEKLLTFLQDDDIITKIPFSEITSFEILNEDLKKDLKFFLDTVIAGKKKDSKKITINCESGGENNAERKIIVSYIRESPVWKISYRLIMSKQQALEQKCLISGWAMVENTTNEDWEDISLSLVAGMPVSFIYDFYHPIFITRPTIEPPKVLSAKPVEIEEELEVDRYEMYEKKKSKPIPPPSPPRREYMESRIGGMVPIMSAKQDIDMGFSLAEKIKAQTSIRTKDLGELFEYNIKNPVTIKRKHSALVPIITEEIKAKKILLYNKTEHGKNPNACLEITNNTDFILERGPVTIIYDENLAGEAIIPFLNKNDTRLLNYAVEQAVVISHEQKSENLGIHRVSFSGAYFYEYYYTNLLTTYKIKNKTSEQKELYLDHPKTPGYKIKESPIEPEETPNYWRFKLELKSRESVSFEIKERCENSTSYYLLNYSRDELTKVISFYVKKRFIDDELEELLREVSDLIGNKNELVKKKTKLEKEMNLMTEEQKRIRENLSVLGKTIQESELRERYVKKMNAHEEAFEKIKSEIENLDTQIDKIEKQIEEKIETLKYD